ncbi:MAG: cytochrome P450 [Rhodobacteraceae bacterium]|nr:cytochrome P450 [Paracoccaceae bacterium]NCV68615.1 cytochrome P450 [Paracoccaceae bacterium]NCX06509.1 cytochrome P450 [Paracoccaceae bacterium]NDH72027.1 cytochrome P450 [Paracoccaceae bacterium]
MNIARDFDLNAISPLFIENPYPTLDMLRQESPVHKNSDGSVYLTRYQDCLAVYRSRDMLSDKTEAFGEKFGQCPLLEHHTTSLIFNDPPYHTVVRKLISGAFTPRKLREMEALIETIVDDLLDTIAEENTIDMVADFGTILPTEIISFMLGIPKEFRQKLRGYSISILGALDPVVSNERMHAGNQAVSEFSEILNDLINYRRENPDSAQQGEVLESLIFGEHEGRKLDQKELIQNCIFLLNAGHETTTSLVSNSVSLFLDHPEQHRKLLDDPTLIEGAVEECLRVESPLQIGNRHAATDFTFGDHKINKGTYIHTSIAGANRDPSVFVDPHKFDIERKNNKHIAFITGIHVCLGATLARMEGRIALGKLLTRFPNMQRDGDAERLPLARFRGFTRLPVKLNP